MLVDKSCKELIANFQAYRWAEDKDGNNKEEPLKENDDAVDALRYAISSSTFWLADFIAE
jgi:phage terminase large subunit